MSKINISFNNTDYQIDSQAIDTATSALRTHLSTVMNGSGATINLGGTAYNIDSTKLQTATNQFVSHLGTIAGNGSKVTVNGREYGIDSAKVAGAIVDLEAVFSGEIGEERLDGDGSEYYTLAPTALSFRSTAPLNELQEVQINGMTVDPANYTLEEGSTIVTLSIDYLKTLDKGSYEVDVISDSKNVKGNFTVKAPELNEHGFYYNQPYTAYVSMFGENESFFIREDGTLDVVGTPSGDVSQCTYTCSGNSMTVVSPVLGTLTATVSDDGTEIFCNELQIPFKIGNESIVSDEDYIYIYKEDIGGYEVTAIDKTKAEYGAIKTGINGISTVKLADDMFFDEYTSTGNMNMVIAPEIPNTVTVIGQLAFGVCKNMTVVKIPDSVKTIGYGAFYNCNRLSSIEIGSGVEFIDENVFTNCENLKKVYISDLSAWCNISLGNEQSSPFNGNRAEMYVNGKYTTNLIVPDGVTSINNRAFYGYDALTSVTIPNGVTTIGSSAFSYCDSLTSVEIPDSVTSIGDRAFAHCDLTSVTIPDSVTSIGDRAFAHCDLTSVTIPDSVQTLGESVFNSNVGLKTAGVASGDYNYKFEWKSTIPRYAFSGCSHLTSIVIPSFITEIKTCAFMDCIRLSDVTFDGTIEQWNDIAKASGWNRASITNNTITDIPATYVQCSDGQVAL